jgi:hypothetical protein
MTYIRLNNYILYIIIYTIYKLYITLCNDLSNFDIDCPSWPISTICEVIIVYSQRYMVFIEE